MSSAHIFDTEHAMAALAKVAADRFRNDLRARIMANITPMIDEVVADIAKDMETRAYKQMDALHDQIIVQYINKAKEG